MFANAHGLHAVYVVTSPGQEVSKVGVADDPVRRLSGIQSGNWNELSMVRYWWTMGNKLSKRVEKEVLNRLSSLRVRGEWLKMPPAELIDAVEAAASDLSIGLMDEDDLHSLAQEWKKKGVPDWV